MFIEIIFKFFFLLFIKVCISDVKRYKTTCLPSLFIFIFISLIFFVVYQNSLSLEIQIFVKYFVLPVLGVTEPVPDVLISIVIDKETGRISCKTK